jgi:hypothetical protein
LKVEARIELTQGFTRPISEDIEIETNCMLKLNVIQASNLIQMLENSNTIMPRKAAAKVTN